MWIPDETVILLSSIFSHMNGQNESTTRPCSCSVIVKNCGDNQIVPGSRIKFSDINESPNSSRLRRYLGNHWFNLISS